LTVVFSSLIPAEMESHRSKGPETGKEEGDEL